MGEHQLTLNSVSMVSIDDSSTDVLIFFVEKIFLDDLHFDTPSETKMVYCIILVSGTFISSASSPELLES